MEFKDILKARRKALGLTQGDIGDMFGIAANNVSDWERGRSMPEASKLMQLAKRLLLNVSQLLGELPIADGESPGAVVAAPTRLQWIRDDEYTLLSHYRETDDSGRITMMNMSVAVPKRAAL